MAEEVKMKMARAMPSQLEAMRDWFHSLEEAMDNEEMGSFEVGRFVIDTFEKQGIDQYERILFGYETLIENTCDQSKTYLEWKPEIQKAMEYSKQMLGFINDLLEEHAPDSNDIDGGTFQDLAEKHGILVPEIHYEPCGEYCRCNEMVYDEEWKDGVKCYKAAAWLAAK